MTFTSTLHVPSMANMDNASDALPRLLARDSPPSYKALRVNYSDDQIFEAAHGMPPARRVLLAQRWCSADGLPPSTAKDAETAIKRLASQHNREQQDPPNGLRSPRNELKPRHKKRLRAPGRQIPHSPPESPARPRAARRAKPAPARRDAEVMVIRQHAQDCLMSDRDPLPFFGLPSPRKLKEVLTRCDKAVLQSLADVSGLSSKAAAANLRLDLLLWCCENAPGENHEGGAALPAAAQQADGFAGDSAATSDSEGSSSSGSSLTSNTSDGFSSDDDEEEGSLSVLMGERENERMRNFEQPIRQPQASQRATEGRKLVKGAVMQIMGKTARSSVAKRVVNTLQEAAQCKEIRPSVERFIATLATHDPSEPTGLKVKSGKFLGPHKPVKTRDSDSPWHELPVSYNFAEEDSLLCDTIVDGLVHQVTTHGGTTVELHIHARALRMLHKTPSVYGWAELASGAGAAAIESTWKPLLTWTTIQDNADELQAEIYRKTAKVVSNLAGEIDICGEKGVKRLCSILFITLLTTQALIAARLSSENTWVDSVRKWVTDLRTKARMDLLLSSQARAAYTLSALAESRGAAAGGAAKRPDTSAPAKQIRTSKPGAPPGGRPREYTDTPEHFVWCSVCSRASHCLWDCRHVLNRIRSKMKQGSSAQKAAEYWIKLAKDRYSSKGKPFLDAFAARDGKTREALLSGLAT